MNSYVDKMINFYKNTKHPECKNFQTYSPNLNTIQRLGTRYFYDPSVQKMFSCMGENIYIEGNLKPYQKLLLSMKKTKYIGKGEYGTVITYNDMIMKVSKELNELKQEFVIGKELEKVNSINFVKSYGFITDRNENIEIVLQEFVEGETFESIIKRKWIKENALHEILVCFLQIFYSLWIANHSIKFVHRDFHLENILIVTLKEPIMIPYYLPTGEIVCVLTPYIVKIIDYGISSAYITPSFMESKFIERKLDLPTTQRTPFYDLYRCLSYILYFSKNSIMFRPLSVIADFIPYLKNLYKGRNFTFENFRVSRTNYNDEELARYFYPTQKEVNHASKNLSMESFHIYLKKLFTQYYNAKYVYFSSGDLTRNIRFIASNPLWAECQPRNIKRLQEKNYKVKNVCRTINEVQNESDFSFYDIATMYMYYKENNPTKSEFLRVYPNANVVMLEQFKKQEMTNSRLKIWKKAVDELNEFLK